MTATTSKREDLLLAAGTRLVHIGPSKTGTTAIQGAFHAARTDLLAQGVRYAGRTRHSRRAAFAVTRRPWRAAGAPPIEEWQALVDEMRTSVEPRLVLSSEALAHADAATIRTIADDLDPSRIHVVVTLRPLVRILPSHWQQNVQTGVRTPYTTWLRHAFAREADGTSRFWHHHRHDRLVTRWAGVVGPRNVTVIVLDEEDRAMALRTFERLLGLVQGTLRPVPELANRSLTWPEVEAVRALNRALHGAAAASARDDAVVRLGATAALKRRTPAAGEPRIETPQWALDRATEIARDVVATIAASGVRIIGDLESLAAPRESGFSGEEPPAAAVPPEVAAILAMGVLKAGGRPHRRRPGARVGAGGARPAGSTSRAAAIRAGAALFATRRAVGRLARQVRRLLRGRDG